LAKSLSSSSISTFLVPDSSIFALVSRVNKVILGAHSILANGGMFAISGALLVATAAKSHSTPVVVCAGQFKLTPLWNLYHDYEALDFGDPSHVLGFDEGDLVDKVDVVNPNFDYVRPELIDAYITNEYAFASTQLARFFDHFTVAIIHHLQFIVSSKRRMTMKIMHCNMCIRCMYYFLLLSMSKNASCGRSTFPSRFIRRLPSFWFSKCFILRS
jgi:hypothetical protein